VKKSSKHALTPTGGKRKIKIPGHNIAIVKMRYEFKFTQSLRCDTLSESIARRKNTTDLELGDEIVSLQQFVADVLERVAV
jgi:hypothetical protein